ncbi:hypothetical protein [Lysobacter capsici]|uniref:hypothetical protein n=1 Tax=Lysobacter capsici TaxID=435897 RepID=UPI000BBAA154|nr:hypothetical protein [Lysobacter capsici]ATE72258.1 hypothetical protein CNO08_13420 [Lysobacter capsici]
MSVSVGRGLLIAAGVVIVAAIAMAVVKMGGPGAQRQMRLDERRVQDLSRIVEELRSYFDAHKALPPDLTKLAAQPGLALSIRDPDTTAPYAYQPGQNGRFRLCARFATDTAQGATAMRDPTPWLGKGWRHPAGDHCYDLDASAAKS